MIRNKSLSFYNELGIPRESGDDPSYHRMGDIP